MDRPRLASCHPGPGNFPPALVPMKILLVHGVGHAERPANEPWDRPWREAITAGLQYYDHGIVPVFERLNYDGLFTGQTNLLLDLAAAARLGFAPVGAAIGEAADAITGWFRPRRGLLDWSQAALEAADGWHAGMVAEWDQRDDLRVQLRRLLVDKINAFAPDVIAAHSLGTVIAYDTFTSAEGRDACKGRFFITFGSQIANPFLKAAHFKNKVQGVGQRHWFHLFNKHDPVLTHEITEPVPDFEQIAWDDGVAGHNAVTDPAQFPGHPGYLQHPLTWQRVYKPLVQEPTRRQLPSRALAWRQTVADRPRRALLIGINDYPDPAARLEGCVNDVFLMSSVLQEIGFEAENIRVVLNERATRAAILERLDWLLDGTADGQERVLYFSGHGAQLPDYNAAEVIDHVDECLVPWDFAWSQGTAITDDDFLRYYTALPYAAKFYAIFDCCHAGGIARGGGRKVRAIIPPDDIRHRMLKWNAAEQMWEERDLDKLNANFGGDRAVQQKFMGNAGHTKRLGRAMSLRENEPKTAYDRAPSARPGPYMPVVFEACEEGAFAYEYHHGAIGHGTFTYALAKEFRKALAAGENPSFNTLRDRVNATMKALRYDQVCAADGPTKVCAGPVLPKPTPAALPASPQPARPTRRRR